MSQVMRRCITGYHPVNSPRHCAHWGSQKMLAFGNGSNIVILVCEPLEQLTTLAGHHANVHRVKWQQESFNHSINVPYRSWLASCDVDGIIIIWDVSSGSKVATFSDGSNKPVLTIDWLSSLQSATRDLLVAIHPPYSLVMWNAATGNKLWKKSYTSEIHSFSLDPFDASRILMLSNDYVLFVTDFMVSQAPSSDGKKIPIPGSIRPSKSPSNVSISSEQNSGGMSANVMLSTTRSFGKQISNVIGATAIRYSADATSLFGDTSYSNVSDDSILQVEFLPAFRDHFMIVQSYKICLVNLDVEAPVCNIHLDSTLSPFVQVVPCKQRDAFYCLHNNGNVTLRVLRPHYSEKSSKQFALNYDVRLQSESIRLSKQHRVMALTVCPGTERNVAVVCSDSRVIIWTVNRVVLPEKQTENEDPRMLPQLSSLRGVVMGNWFNQVYLRDLYLSSRLFLDHDYVVQNTKTVQLKFIMSGLFTSLGLSPYVLSMCPPLTTKNFLFYKPILAVGSSSGIVYLIDLNSGNITKEFSLHTGAVAGIEWCSLTSFLTFSVIVSGTSSNNSKNELIFVDATTGKCQSLLSSKNGGSVTSPLSMVKVSPKKNYFVAVYKWKPLEIWDVATKRMLREVKISSTAPITSVAWCPNARFSKSKRASASKEEAKSSEDGSPGKEAAKSKPSQQTSATSSSSTESFVFTNSAGMLCHLTIDAGVLQDASRVPPEGGMGSVTAITWKGDVLALGDNEGGVSLWDLKNKLSRGINVPRIGRVRKLKFAPGKGNSFLMILLVDGVDIWDISDTSHVSSLRQKTSMGQVVDADWATSSEPVLAFSDGTVRVCDLYLNCHTSTVKSIDSFLPALWPSKNGICLKYAMLFAPQGTLKWDQEGSKVDSVNVETDAESELANQINLMPSCVLKQLSEMSTLERCISVAKIFNDTWDDQFWHVAKFYLTRFKEIEQILLTLDDSEENDCCKSSDGGSEFESKVLDCEASDYVYPNEIFRQALLERQYLLASAHCDLSPDSTARLKDQCARNLLKFGDAEEASVLLLSTDPVHRAFHVNSLKTCLINLIASCGDTQKHNEDISKLVATNMIASGFLDEGVEVLCMYKNYLDACRYLQSYGKWDESISLAKVALQDSESYQEIVKKWTEFLVSPQINQKNLAILVFISTNQFYKALQLLLATQQSEKAYLLLRSMQEMGLISNNSEDLDLYKDLQMESNEHVKTALVGMGFREVSL